MFGLVVIGVSWPPAPDGFRIGWGWIELVFVLVCALLVLNAGRRGFMREGSLLVGLGLALWLAGRLYRDLGPVLLRGVHTGPWPAVLYVGLTLLLVLLAAGLSSLAAPLIRDGPLRALDRLAGLVVGLVEATLVIGLLATLGERIGAVRLPSSGPIVRAVELAGVGLAWLSATIPGDAFHLPGG